MRSKLWITYALTMGGLLASGSVSADGGFYPPPPPPGTVEKWLISEPQQKAVVLFSKGTEDLIVSPSFKGSAGKFAWVIPVPSRPKVQVLDGALFHELKLLTPEYRESRGWYSRGGGPGGGGPPPVQILEHKIAGSYDVTVLKSTDAGALKKWLRENGYRVPEVDRFVATRIKPIQHYVEKGWTFVACRVTTKAEALHVGALAPLRLTFKTKRPVYPLRMSSMNPGDFWLVLYVVIPSDELPRQGGWLMAAATRDPWRDEAPKDLETISPIAHLPEGQRQYPTLARLCGKELTVFGLRKSLGPYGCSRDIIWDLHRRPGDRR